MIWLLSSLAIIALGLVTAGAVGASLREKGSDSAVVAAGKITAADVPGGWKSQPQPTGKTSEFEGIPGCKRQSAAAKDARARARVGRSPQFYDPGPPAQKTTAASTVYVFTSAKRATQFTNAFKVASAARCIQQELDHSAGGTTGVGPATTTTLSNLPAVGDDRVGYEASVPLSARGQTVVLYFDVVELRAGRAVVSFAFTSYGDPPQMAPLVSSVVGRVQQAQA
jgi:hypothetical protein